MSVLRFSVPAPGNPNTDYWRRIRDVALSECMRAKWSRPASSSVEINLYVPTAKRIQIDALISQALTALDSIAVRDLLSLRDVHVHIHQTRKDPRIEIAVQRSELAVA